MTQESSSLGVFRTDMGITLSFGTNTYFIDSQDPFYNIANKSIDLEDYVAKREGVGPEFRDMLLGMIDQIKGEGLEN